MTTTASNTSVRERRRRSNPIAIEQMDVLRALTAAEYSRRQFVLNYAASRDTKLLIPGQKADTIKQAEEWVVQWMSQNGYGTISNDHFKYTVDERLWNDLVGADIPFPFAFMRGGIAEVAVSPEAKTGDPQELGQGHEVMKADGGVPTTQKRRSKSDAFLPDAITVPTIPTVEVRLLDDGQAQTTTTANGNGKTITADGRLSRQTTNTSTATSNYTGTQLSSAAPTNSNNGQSSATPASQPRRGSLLSGITASSSVHRKERKKSLPNAALPTTVEASGTTNKTLPSPNGPLLDKKRSMSLTSLETDDLKMGRRASAAEKDKFPFLVRWSRSWGRRTSA